MSSKDNVLYLLAQKSLFSYFCLRFITAAFEYFLHLIVLYFLERHSRVRAMIAAIEKYRQRQMEVVKLLCYSL